MNQGRLFLWLAFACSFLTVVHVLLGWDGARPARFVRRTALAPEADGATAVSLTRHGTPLTLSRVTGAWRIASPFSAPADERAVLRLLDALAFAPLQASMSDAELRKLGRDRRDFALFPPRLSVETLGRRGKVRVFIGGRTPADDGVYASVDGEPTVFIAETNVLAAADAPADCFRSRVAFASPLAGAESLDIKRGKGAFMRIVRTESGWRRVQPSDAPVSGERVRAFLETLSGLSARAFIWPVGASNEPPVASLSFLAGFGLDPDAAVAVSVRSPGGRRQIVSFGKTAGESLVYALVQNGGALVTLDAAACERVFSAAEGFADTRLFPYESGAVTALLLSGGDGRVLLTKSAGGDWRIDEPVAAPADAETVAALIGRIVALRQEDRSDAGVRVGVATTVSNLQSVAVSREAATAGVDLAHLRAREMLSIAPEDVRRLVRTPAGGRAVSLLRDETRRTWRIESAEAEGPVDGAAVSLLLGELNPLRAVRVEKLCARADDLGAYGLEIPQWVLSIDSRREGAVRRNVLIGERTSGGRFATLGATDAVFVLSDETVARLTGTLVGD